MAPCSWKPLQYFKQETDARFALVLLNQREQCESSLIRLLWKRALFKVAVDGGANCLYNSFISDRDDFLPDMITGDFDSIQPEVKSFYEEKGVEIIETADQNYTDFTKALKELSQKIKDKKVESVVVIGPFGGRLDHVFANINTLYESSTFIDKNILLLSEETAAFLMHPGHHTIEVDPEISCEYCGLIPVGEPCNAVTTQGLKWNLDDERLKFGDLISTSNTLESNTTKTVTVQTDRPLLWTMELNLSKVSSGCY